MKLIETTVEETEFAWRLWRYLPASILSVAVVSKVVNAPALIHSEGLISNSSILVLVVSLEVAAALLIVKSPLMFSWIMTSCLFSTFLIISAYSIFFDISCNCFGIGFSSDLSFTLDVAILFICASAKPKTELAFPAMRTLQIGLLFGILGAGFSVGRLAFIDSSNVMSYLTADRLIGKKWPIDEKYNSKLSSLSEGNWLVIIVRQNCNHCDNLLNKHFTRPAQLRAGERTALFVSGGSLWPVTFDRVQLNGSSDATITWESKEPFVASPAIFQLIDGVVVAAADGAEADNFLDGLNHSSRLKFSQSDSRLIPHL